MKQRFKYKQFQTQDYARAAIHDGIILAHSTGLGKSLAAFTLPALKVGFRRDTPGRLSPLAPVLVVAPEQLHQQLCDEARSKFGIECIKLDCQQTYLELSRFGQVKLAPGYYVTSYTQLCSNKVEKAPYVKEVMSAADVESVCKFYGIKRNALTTPTKPKLSESRFPWQPRDIPMSDRPAEDPVLGAITEAHAKLMDGVDEVVNGFRCVYSPSLADLCGHEFACVVIDEGVKMKGDETLIGRGIRSLNPPYRLVLTATPIKNRLPDLFWLAWWAAGGKKEAHARFPYSESLDDKAKFEEEFLVGERNLSKERAQNNGRPLPNKKRGGGRRKGKKTAEVCNIHRLWKFIAPIILRRQKNDIGEDIVPKIRQVVRVPMGKQQSLVYAYHLKAQYVDKHDKPALGAQLQALRSAAAAPHSALLDYQGEVCSKVDGKDIKLPFRSGCDYTPKVAAALTLIEQIVRRGEQVVVFSALHEPLDTIARKLTEAGVPFYLMDGRTSTAARGRMSAEFQKGRPHAHPVTLAGVGSMSEGHNWWRANNAILLAYDWAMDKFEQAINRIHRLTSPKTVNVFPIISTGTIDRKLESLIGEKCDSSELVLDGRLLDESDEELNMAELLKIARQEFSEATTLDERELELQWPELRGQLADAWNRTRMAGTNGGVRKSAASAFRLPPLPQIVRTVRLGYRSRPFVKRHIEPVSIQALMPPAVVKAVLSRPMIAANRTLSVAC